MSRVLTFSRTYPAYHPRRSEPTFFVEKILNAIGVEFWSPQYLQKLFLLNTQNIAKGKLTYNDIESFYNGLNSQINSKKMHTIRALRKDGLLWKPGDTFSLRVWSGEAYNSPQIIIAPDIEVNKVWDFEIRNEFDSEGWYNFFYINNRLVMDDCSSSEPRPLSLQVLAKNDGLEDVDMIDWFKAEWYKVCNFKGQIICWNNSINY